MGGELYFISGVKSSDVQPEANSEDNEYGMGFERKDNYQEDVKLSKIDVDSLKETIKELSGVFDTEETDDSKYAIDQIKVALGINGSGKVAILGTGAQVGAEASIEVTLKRKNKSK